MQDRTDTHTSEFTADERIYRKLEQSPFFQTYREAFQAATGLPVRLINAEMEPGQKQSCHFSAFCEAINNCGGGCDGCSKTRSQLMAAATVRAETATCFAGLRETMIPVRSGNRCYAYLSVGEVRTSDTGNAIPAELRSTFAEMGIDAETKRELTRHWREAEKMELSKYQGLVTLLAAFALQLSDLLNRLVTEESNAEPEVVVKAKRYVNAHLEDRISLEDVAGHVGVSPFYFCKVFKQAAGMTLTEYVNRRRIEWAKRQLSNPRSRITEVAFDVGFQSISQFNRSFLKYVGESPTRYRESLARKTKLPSSAAVA